MKWNGEKYLNLTNVAFNGQMMTIIEYVHSRDITVRFDDGGIREHIKLSMFKSGEVTNPNRPNESPELLKRKNERVGEKRIANNGMEMEIIEYYNAKNITIKFTADNAIIYNKTYKQFCDGTVSNPKAKLLDITSAKSELINDFKAKHIGEKGVTKGGTIITIIAYRGSGKSDVDAITDNGVILLNTSYRKFKAGTIKITQEDIEKAKDRMSDYMYIINQRERWVGKSKLFKSGVKVTISDYENDDNIELTRADGKRAKHQTLQDYKDETVDFDAHKKDDTCIKQKMIEQAKARLGQVGKTNAGQTMIIIAYRSSADIDVILEGETILRNKKYDSFLKGSIKDPNMTIESPQSKKSERLHETHMATNGQIMEIIAYRAVADIDVKFEDGSIAYKRSYERFKNGQIANPSQKLFSDKNNKSKLWETNVANNGQLMTIIECKKLTSMKVRFEDGTVVPDQSYSNFKKGQIVNPNAKKTDKICKKNVMHKKNIMLDGEIATVIGYKSRYAISVQFDTGGILTDVTYNNWKLGLLKNPDKIYDFDAKPENDLTQVEEPVIESEFEL